MKIILLFIFVITFTLNAQSFDFSDFNKILKSNLTTSHPNKAGLQTSFDYTKAYNNSETSKLIELQKKKLAEFKLSSLTKKNDAVSFWINSYNFFMIVTILENGFKKGKLKINSVKDLGSFFNPYRVFKKEVHLIGGKKMSLDHMEKSILLGKDYKKKGWKDARIHFAVNCASVGCPPLLGSIYESKTLDQSLDDNLKKAFKTSRHLHIKGKTLHLSSLFKWYKKDFEEHSGSVKGFIKKYVDDSTYAAIKATKKISHIDYDWKLNSEKNFK